MIENLGLYTAAIIRYGQHDVPAGWYVLVSFFGTSHTDVNVAGLYDHPTGAINSIARIYEQIDQCALYRSPVDHRRQEIVLLDRIDFDPAFDCSTNPVLCFLHDLVEINLFGDQLRLASICQHVLSQLCPSVRRFDRAIDQAD